MREEMIGALVAIAVIAALLGAFYTGWQAALQKACQDALDQNTLSVNGSKYRLQVKSVESCRPPIPPAPPVPPRET